MPKNPALRLLPPAEPQTLHPGERLKALRRGASLTITELAERAQVSAGTISEVERGKVNPSIRVLERLRSALGVPLSDLFQQPEPASAASRPRFVKRVGERIRLKVGDAGLTKEILSPPGEHEMTFLEFSLPAGVACHEVLIGPGEKAGLVMSGTIGLTVDGEEALLHAGDTFQFASLQSHSFRNPGGVEARVLWIMTTKRVEQHF
jgi:transcriptional regulator with XRE-family HTH domain